MLYPPTVIVSHGRSVEQSSQATADTAAVINNNASLTGAATLAVTEDLDPGPMYVTVAEITTSRWTRLGTFWSLMRARRRVPFSRQYCEAGR